MIRRPPRSTLDRSSAASDVYKRQDWDIPTPDWDNAPGWSAGVPSGAATAPRPCLLYTSPSHETVLEIVCRLLLEKKKKEGEVTGLPVEATKYVDIRRNNKGAARTKQPYTRPTKIAGDSTKIQKPFSTAKESRVDT